MTTEVQVAKQMQEPSELHLDPTQEQPDRAGVAECHC